MTILQLPPRTLESGQSTGERAQEIFVPDFVLNHDTSHMTLEQVCAAANSSRHDELLFAAHVGLQRFIYREANGLLGPDEDPAELYYSFLGSITSRTEFLDAQAVGQPEQHAQISQAA